MPSASHSVRVATWNILSGVDPVRGRVDLAGVAAALAALDADVVAIQEVDRGLARTGGAFQLDVLAEKTGYFPVYAPALLGNPGDRWQAIDGPDPGGPAYGIGVLTRRPPLRWRRLRLPGGGSGTRRLPLPRSSPGWDGEPRVAVQVEIAAGATTLQVTAAHLSYMPWRGARQLRALLPAAGRRVPALLMGDLNLPPWAVGRLTPGWQTAGGSATYPAGDARIQVDHVLGRGVGFSGTTNREFPVSDHAAIVTDVHLDPG